MYAAQNRAWSKRKRRLRLLAQFHFGGKSWKREEGGREGRAKEGRSEKERRAEKEKGNRLCSEISYGIASTALRDDSRWHQ